MDYEKIYAEVKKLRIDISDKRSLSYLKMHYSWLYTNYPSLFQMVIDGIDLDLLHKLISVKSKVQTGELTEEQGRTQFGQNLADRYLSHIPTKHQ